MNFTRQVAPVFAPVAQPARKAATFTTILLAAGITASCATNDDVGHDTAIIAPITSAPIPDPLSYRAIGSSIMGRSTDDGSSATRPGRQTAKERVREMAESIAADLVASCPVAAPGDQPAFDACRKAMHGGSVVRTKLAETTLWGRQNKDGKPLKETNLTKFGRDVLTGMYLPLFMFSGRSEVTYSTEEKLFRIELGARFRNRLQPGQFPYPFWHEDEKWATYEGANAILLWVDPKEMVVRAAQFTMKGTLEPAGANTPVARRQFDGKWMWTDAKGETQPKATLFDGLFSQENPHLKKLDAAYKDLALSLRAGQCSSCHVPNNPYGSKRLVLMQTPAHAAAEIKRIMSTVRRDTMPLNETSGIEEPLAKEIKGELLRRAAAFERVVDAAKAWETARGMAPKPARPGVSATPKRTAETVDR